MQIAGIWRWLVIGIGSLMLAGCTQYSETSGINRAEALGLPIDPITLPKLPPITLDLALPDQYNKQFRDRFVEEWMARSDILCRQYKDKLMTVSRDTRLATHATQTLLSGLATIFTPLSVVHPLTGASTIVGGIGAAADSDVFEKQGGEIIATAIQTARENQANQIEKNLSQPIDVYSIYRAERDVAEYHNMCSLETGLGQIRTALRATAPDAGVSPPAAQGTQTNPVQTGAAAEAGKNAAMGAAAGAEAARVKGLSPAVGAALGAVAGASSTGGAQKAAKEGAAAVDNAAPAVAPQRPKLPPEPACMPSGSVIPLACPPLSPQFRSDRKRVSDRIRALRNVATLQAVAHALGLPTPVATARCIKRDIVSHIEQICTDDKLQELNRALAGPPNLLQ